MIVITNNKSSLTISPSFNNLSVRNMETDMYAISAWDKGAGHNIPNNWLHKGQSSYDGDRDLLDHLNSEFVNLSGMVGEYYVTSYDKKYDSIFGEDNDRRYVRKFDFMFFTDEM